MDLQSQMESRSTEELLIILGNQADNYTATALDVARQVLAARDIPEDVRQQAAKTQGQLAQAAENRADEPLSVGMTLGLLLSPFSPLFWVLTSERYRQKGMFKKARTVQRISIFWIAAIGIYFTWEYALR